MLIKFFPFVRIFKIYVPQIILILQTAEVVKDFWHTLVEQKSISTFISEPGLLVFSDIIPNHIFPWQQKITNNNNNNNNNKVNKLWEELITYF
jgi:hypothetical protein